MAIEPVTRKEMLMSGQQLEPITRKELFLAKAAGMDVQTPEPITREEMFLSKISGGSGGGSAPVVEPLSATENGTYTAPSGVDGYNPVTVNVASLSDSEWEEQWALAIAREFGKSPTALPNGLTIIGKYSFYENANLHLPSLPDSVQYISSKSFYNCNGLALAQLPSGLVRIDDYAFYNCRKLNISAIPASVKNIYSSAFRDCIGLKELTFEGKPDSISSDVFAGCKNLLTINVPWAEGEVANAPWGATNATIHYNYTGG